MKTIFKIAIGDWSGNGHCICNYYKVESDKVLNDVREAHYKIKGHTGIDIDKICGEHGESYISDDIKRKLLSLDFGFSKGESFPAKTYLSTEDCHNMGSKDCCEVWLFLLNYIDSELHLKIIDVPDPMLQFCGYDEKGRHIGGPGYGCFD